MSGGEILVLVGAAAILLGKKELPVIAKAVGRATGKVVTLLNSAREQFNEFSKDSKLAELHEEVRQNMYELNTIKSEVRWAGKARFGTTPLRQPTGIPSTMAGNAMTGLPPVSGGVPNTTTTPLPLKTPPTSTPLPSYHGSSEPRLMESVAKVSRNPRLAELAFADMLLKEQEAADGTMHPPPRQARGRAGGGGGRGNGERSPSERPGSEVLEEVILDTLIRDHVDRLHGQGAGGGGGGPEPGGVPPPHQQQGKPKK